MRAFVLFAAGCGFSSHSSPAIDGASDAPPDVVLPGCGDHVVQSGEECDDGNATAGDGCAACKIEPAWDCSSGTCKRVVGVAFSLREALASAGGSTGGGTFSSPCAAGAAIVGVEGDYSDNTLDIGRMRVACAVLAVGTDGSVTWSTVQNTPYAASESNGSLGTERCANDRIVVGYTANAGNYLSGLALICMPVSFVHGAFAFGATTSRPMYGPAAGTTLPASQCAAGEATTVFEGKAGSVFDHFDLHCAALAPVTQ